VAGDDQHRAPDPDDRADKTAVLNMADLQASGSGIQPDRHLLVMMQGSQVGQVIALADQPYRIGRHEESEILLPDAGISRRHARLFPEDGGYAIEDLQSANGTFVQGERIVRRRLCDGDIVQFGSSVVLRYSLVDPDQEAMLRHLYVASITDPLTRAYNREHLDARLLTELSYARRHRTQLSMIMFDVDHFKAVNDTYGHQAGDAVLQEIAAKVHKCLRNEDVFARYGGEEFAVVLREIDIGGAQRAAERLRMIVRSLGVVHDSHTVRVTISAGCAAVAELPELSAQGLIALADRRLYVAKRSGRDRVVSSG